MSEIKFSNFTNEDGSNGPDFVGLTTFTTPYYFVPPSGTTAQRPSGDGIAPGMLRFNTDIGRLEVWRGDHWATILGESPNLDGGARALIAGGGAVPNFNVNTIEYITISTLGNAQDYGDLTVNGYRIQGLANQTRAVFGGNYGASLVYTTISSTGNTQSFGNSINTVGQNGHGISNQTRGIFGGGDGNGNILDYISINSTGNSVDFGDLLETGRSNCAAASSSVRGIFAGGFTSPAGNSPYNSIDYVTISTTGNASDFGDLSIGGVRGGGASNGTRMIIAGTFYTSPSTTVNAIQFITISTLGNAQDFGDTGYSVLNCRGASSSTRAVWAGGYMGRNIGYNTFASTGNMQDFGDLTIAPLDRINQTIVSNGHGGL